MDKVEYVMDLKRYGNSYGFRIPPDLVRSLGASEGESFKITVERVDR